MARAATTIGGASALRFHLRQSQPGLAASAEGYSCKAGRPPSSGGGHWLRDSRPRPSLAQSSPAQAPASTASTDGNGKRACSFTAIPNAAPTSGRSSPPGLAAAPPRVAALPSDLLSLIMQRWSSSRPPWRSVLLPSGCREPRQCAGAAAMMQMRITSERASREGRRTSQVTVAVLRRSRAAFTLRASGAV